MIERVTCYRASDGALFDTVQAAQKQELCKKLFAAGFAGPIIDNILQWVFSQKDELVQILRMSQSEDGNRPIPPWHKPDAPGYSGQYPQGVVCDSAQPVGGFDCK